MLAPVREPSPDREAVAEVSVAEAIVDLLVRQGVDTFFGIPGGPIISVFHRVLLHREARLIESRQESTGAFAAMGYWRATGRVPALVVTAGPGITNALTGLAAAYAERIPMIVLCGDVAGDGRRLLQDLGADGRGGIEQIFAPVTREVRRIRRPAAGLGEVTAALQAARSPTRPGPAIVVVPVDAADATARIAPVEPKPVATPPAHVPRAAIEAVVEPLRAARRPLVVLGGACRSKAARVARLVDALGIPFVTTPQAKGVVSEEHPLSLRNCGMSASIWARHYTAAEPDVALVLGSDLDDVSTAGTPVVGPEGGVLHVDTDATVFGRNFPTRAALNLDLGSLCDRLSSVVPDAGLRADGLALAAEAKDRSPFDESAFACDASPKLAPHRAIADLERAARPSDRFVSDIGEHMLFALHYLTATDPERFTIHLGLGSMGSGIGSAVGLALADPARRVICICGDGGMQMTGAEILVARAHNLRLLFAVFNDARYNMVYHGYRLTHGREAPWATPQVDFTQWAAAHGVPSRRIGAPGQITASLIDDLLASGPGVLDIRHDPNIRIRGDGRIDALRQMSLGGVP